MKGQWEPDISEGHEVAIIADGTMTKVIADILESQGRSASVLAHRRTGGLGRVQSRLPYTRVCLVQHLDSAGTISAYLDWELVLVGTNSGR